MVDEAELLRQLQNQDTAALAAAIKTYTPYLSTVLYRAFGAALGREDTEEILSDTFFVLWQNAGQIDRTKGSIRVYLAAVARNAGGKRLQNRRELLSLDELNPGKEPSAIDGQAESAMLWDAVSGLGERDAELFVRYYKYGESLKEIAAATGLCLSTVKTRLSRGKRKLKTILTEAEGL